MSDLRGVVTRLALFAGYVPIDRGCIERLTATRGEFRRSSSERLYLQIRAVIVGATAAFLVGLSYALYRDDPSPWSALVPLAASALLTTQVIVLIRRMGITYVFEHGHLSSLTSGGKVLWREDLAGLIDMQGLKVPGTRFTLRSTWLTLYWRGRKRRMECYESLGIKLFGSAPNNALEQTRNG